MAKITSVMQWGYICGSDQEASSLVWPVRFKPAVTAVLVVLGLTVRSPWLLVAVGGLGILGTFFQKLSWIDLLYNHSVRHLFKAPALGPDPSVRRWLCGLADFFVLVAGLALARGHRALAWGFGGLVIFLAGSVVLTGICLPAFLYYKWKGRKQVNTKIAVALIVGSVAVGTLVPSRLLATDGYFDTGYGAKAQGIGGAGVAFPQDALAPATNPAGISFVENRFDVGLEYFRPIRNTEVTGNQAPSNNISYDASDDKNFFIPSLGFNHQVGDRLNLGVAAYGNGGMNTTYTRNVTLFGSSSAGIDLEQGFISPTVSYKVLDNTSLGVALNLAYQRFKATGLENFAAFPGLSASPNQLTDQGYDWSTGIGVRVGWLSKLTPWFSLGATYQSKTWMSRFKEYQGLFAGQGSFDIPENYAVGIAVKPISKLTAAVDVERINYSGVASVGNALLPALGQSQLGSDSGAGFGWKDVTVEKVGVAYDLNDEWTLRAGYNHTSQPIPSSETLFNLLAPGVVQDHLTLGTTYKFAKVHELSFAYTHGFEKTVSGSQSIPANFGGGNANITLYEDSFNISYGYRF